MPKHEAAVVIPAYNEEKMIRMPLVALSVATESSEAPVPVVVVDNGSTDNTLDAIERCKSLSGIDIHLLREPEKGTGAAADTGFRYAIEELGANIIARTDADTLPLPPWFRALYWHHKTNPGIRLLTGPAYRGFDAKDRTRDIYIEDLAVPLAKKATRLVRSVKYCSSGFLFHFAPGYNLSTTKEAYLETGGFPRSGISVQDEDVVYNALIAQTYGRKAMGYEKQMEVFTSSRRVRSMGYFHTALHYASTKNRSEETDYR